MALSKDMAASLSNSRYKEMGGEVRTAWTERVYVPKRARQLNERTVAEIEELIEQVGLLQPIGVKSGAPGPSGGTTLIFGAHRYEAWRRRLAEAEASGERDEIERWQMIPVVLYPADMPDSLGEAVEIMENLLRQDLSREERQAFAGKYGKWLREQQQEVSANGVNTQVSANSANPKPKAKGGPKADPWFKDWYSGAPIAAKTAENWWNDFLASTEREKVTPGKAEPPLRDAFFAWLQARDDEKAGKAAEAEAKAKAEADAKARDERCDVLLNAIDDVVRADGEDVAVTIVCRRLPVTSREA